jgi:hypothetical protein
MDKESVLDALDEAIYTMEKLLAGRNPYSNERPNDVHEIDMIIGMREDWGISWHALNAIKNHVSSISDDEFESDEIQDTYGRFLDMDYSDDNEYDSN